MSFLDGVTITDDLDIAYDPENYQDQVSPAPPAAGNYNFRIVKFGVRKDRDGKPVLRQDRWPIYVLEQVEIVEPSELARGVGLFQDLSTQPFDRMGKVAIEVADFIRSVDQSRALVGLSAFDEALSEFAQTRATFRGYLDWTAYDSEYVKGALDALGLGGKRFAEMADDEKSAAREVYRKAKLTGQKRFISKAAERGVAANAAHLWVGPSGDTIEARPKITRFYPSLEDVRLIDVARLANAA